MSWSHRLLRVVPIIGTATFLASCSNIGGDLSSVIDVAGNIWNGPQSVPLEQAASVPYASIGVRVRGYNELMLVLATNAEGQQLWTSDVRIAIVTQNGHIVRTAGLGRDLSGLRFVGTAHPGGANYSWEADFKDMGLYGVTGDCQPIATKNEVITVLGKELNTQRIDERCETSSHQLSWSFRNTYWLDPVTGLAWRSIQHIHPRFPALEITVLRPFQ